MGTLANAHHGGQLELRPAYTNAMSLHTPSYSIIKSSTFSKVRSAGTSTREAAPGCCPSGESYVPAARSAEIQC
jgi:hypothetical protein